MRDDTAARVRQAARSDGSARQLNELARDPDIIVRATLALNRSCGPELDHMLAGDDDERVRALLGARIARLLPDLDGAEQGHAAEHVRTILAELARDQAIRVRAAVAHAIKAMAAAPHPLVVALANDSAVEVSEPVIRLSPVLTDSDLLQLLATPPIERAAESIASRPTVSAAVADAIVAHASVPAIQKLLANDSACIQEATLDALVGRAPHHTDWHAPLVRRPHLSAHAVRALSTFIAADLLSVLASRDDLDPAQLDTVKQRLDCLHAPPEEDAMVVAALQMKRQGELTEGALLEAAELGQTRRVAVLLAVAAGVDLSAVDRVVELRSAKALVSLAWRSGFTMRAGAAVQTALAQLSPDHVLEASASGGFPLSREEMEWHMELVVGTATPGAGPRGQDASAGSLDGARR